MVTADETDTEAMANGSTTRPGSTSRRSPTATRRRRDHSSKAPFSQPLRRKTLGVRKLPTNQGVFFRLLCVGGANARLDGNAAGARGVMLTFDDFRIGMKQFGQRIRQLMKFRATALAA